MKVAIIDPPENCERTIATAAKMCYSDSGVQDLVEKIGTQDVEKFIRKIIEIGHHSVLEHVVFNFVVEGISRVTSHQLVRHRIASYSQQSQRYVKLDNTFDYITPPQIAGIEDMCLSMRYEELMKETHELYMEYLRYGVPAEDARYILPNATETKVFITMNIRTLLHFFKVRCCNRAQWEIRDMAIEMLTQCKQISRILFESAGPSCVSSHCVEGNMSCRNPLNTREKFLNL